MSNAGRPKKDDPRHKVVTLKFNEDELSRLKAYAEKYGLTISGTIHEGLQKLYDEEEKK